MELHTVTAGPGAFCTLTDAYCRMRGCGIPTEPGDFSFRFASALSANVV